MDDRDKRYWQEFNSKSSNKLTTDEVKMISVLHAKYFHHKFHIPCSCNPKNIIRWIDDLNKFFGNE